MRFFRNPEIKRLCLVLCVATAFLSLTGFLLNPAAGLMTFACCFLLSAVFLLFQRRKYLEIEKLSDYLRRIAAGEYALDVRDNKEGELSILENEIYKVTSMLSEYNGKLLKDRQALADSLSDISHQLKTPLTSMMMMADLLSDESLPPDKREQFTKQIQTQLERIQWLVSSLLKLSKLDVGTVNMRREAVLIRQLVEKAAAPLQIPMELKEQTLSFEGSDDAAFIGDGNWSAEALLNILKNCMEHTPAGGRLSIRWKDNPIFAEIIVSDNGEGIDKEDLPHIFTRFYRGKNANEDSVGIGLAMAKSILSRQGGDIAVKSERGTGTSFIIHMYKTVV